MWGKTEDVNGESWTRSLHITYAGRKEPIKVATARPQINAAPLAVRSDPATTRLSQRTGEVTVAMSRTPGGLGPRVRDYPITLNHSKGRDWEGATGAGL